MPDDETVHIRAEVTPEQRDLLDAIGHSRTEVLRHLLDEHAEQCLGQDPDGDEPEPVRCDRCESLSMPMFWYDEQVHCRTCLRERVPDFEWPPTED